MERDSRLLALFAAALAAGCSAGGHPSHRTRPRPPASQSLRLCADRWNQNRMVDYGPAPARVTTHLTAAERKSAVFWGVLGRPDHVACAVVLGRPHALDEFICVMNRAGAFDCPLSGDGSPRQRSVNARIGRHGALALRLSLKGTHPAPRLAWQHYPLVDGFIKPWTPSGKLRPGLELIPHAGNRGHCSVGGDEIPSTRVLRCLPRSIRYRYDVCFPRRRPWHDGDVAACAYGPGDRRFARWKITRN